MKTDIQIAQEAQMMPIREVTAGFGITEDDMESIRQSFPMSYGTASRTDQMESWFW